MYIVAFNGPPRSGKDTMAEMLANHMDKQGVTVPVRFESLSLPLREIAYAATGWVGDLDGPNYEEFKTTTFKAFGVTGRQVMIDVSEKFLKPTYGIEIMAQLLRSRNELYQESVLLIRDCGFQVEMNPMMEWVGHSNVVVVPVMRDGCDFTNDSREWVTHPYPTRMYPTNNNGSLDDLKTEAGRIYGRLVNQLGWKL